MERICFVTSSSQQECPKVYRGERKKKKSENQNKIRPLAFRTSAFTQLYIYSLLETVKSLYRPLKHCKSPIQMGDPAVLKREHFGKLEYGCEHYKRRCKIRAPCCNELFPCRHCHNEAMSSLGNPKERHELVRQDVKLVTCSVCNTEQEVSKVCSNCGVNMGEYYCPICKFYDDDTSKEQFHCDECGICRVGGRDNFFHCKKCGSCYSVSLLNNHFCVENSMKSQCPVCYEYLFDSTQGTTIMKCGHTMHMECFHEMANQNQYRCPICSKTVLEMSANWRSLDLEIEAVRMPEEYRHEVSILCNDCNTTSQVPFHILGHKCSHCASYNTRRISAPENQ